MTSLKGTSLVEQGPSSIERVAVEEVEEVPRPRPTAQVVSLSPPRPEAHPPAPPPPPMAEAWAPVSEPRPTPPPSPTAISPANSPPPRQSPVLAALRVIARILAVRFILLLSVLGGFVLGVMAMLVQSWTGLAILSAYALLTVLPLVWLEVGQRPKDE